jgi:hypothetical protein
MIRGKAAKAIALYLERSVEARPEVLECNRRGELDYLCGCEIPPEFLEDLVRNLRRRLGHPFRVSKHGPLHGVKMRALVERTQIGKLLVSDALLSADGRIHVHSEWAPRDLCCTKASQSLDPRLDYPRAG